MRALMLLLLACNLPTAEDVREATSEAADRASEICKATIRQETPGLVATVTAAAVLACASLTEELDDARAVVEASRDMIVFQVLVSLGCGWDGRQWDCSTSLRCSP